MLQHNSLLGTYFLPAHAFNDKYIWYKVHKHVDIFSIVYLTDNIV